MEKSDVKDEYAQHIEDAADKSPAHFEDSSLDKGPALELDEIERTATGKYIWLVSITASIGGMLFGYDTGIISAVLVYIGDSLGHNLASHEKEVITSLCSTGAFVGAIIAGLTSDRYGRKPAIYAGCFLFTFGAILQAASYSLAQMAAGRLIVGFGVGSAAMIVPMYLAEIAPTKYRGRLIGLNNMSITGGQVISYAIGAAFVDVPHGWRYMVGLGGVPSLLLACLLPFCPESPRQLVYKGKKDEAAVVVQSIFKNGTPEQVANKVQLIQTSIDQYQSQAGRLTRREAIVKLHTNPAYFRSLVCACGLMAVSQLSGFNVLMYYSPTLFALVGFSDPVAVGLVVAGGNFIMTFVNMLIVDPWGRRRVLVSTVWGMSASLAAVAIAFRFIDINTDTMEVTDSHITGAGLAALVFIIVFVLFYGVSIGNTAWMSTDFFPLEVRAMGTMWMTCCAWGPNVIVSSTFLTMLKSLTPSGTFGFYSATCGIGWILILLFYPEVSGLTLEETSEVFEHGFGVRYARKLRKERRLVAQENSQQA